MRFLADENLNGAILRGLLRRKPELDIIRVQDTEVAGADDPTVLAWAAEVGRVLITHDVTTITSFAYQRIEANLPMLGVLEISYSMSIGQAIEEILLAVECLSTGEWEQQIVYLPL